MPRRFLLLELLLAVALPAAKAHAQGGGSGPVLIEPRDFGPDGGGRRKAALVRERRLTLLRAGDLRTLNAIRGGPSRTTSIVAQSTLATAVSGTFHVPVIPIAFKDISVPYPIADFQCLLFSQAPAGCPADGWTFTRPYSIATFYEQLSHHRIAMDGVVFA